MTTRREFLSCGIAGATVLGAPLVGLPARAADTTPPSREAWIAAALREPDPLRAGDQLLLARFADATYVLRSTLYWEPKAEHPSRFSKVVVPPMFVTDLASIPPVFYSVLRPDGDYIMSAIIHDYLYWTQQYSRADSDLIFNYSMEEYGIDAAKRAVMVTALRTFGGSAWDTNRRLREQGEQRILASLPKNSTTTWADWKKEKGAFPARQ